MTKDGKYGKLTIDVPQKKRGWYFLMKKLILILLILLVKDMIQKKKKYSNLSKVVFKTLIDLSGLENKKRSKTFKNIINGGCIPTYYNDHGDHLSLLELIIGSINAGNDSKIKNRGMAILDELLKLGAISKT